MTRLRLTCRHDPSFSRFAPSWGIYGDTMHVTANVTAINQPVHIAVPAAGQVATLPRSGASGI